jgi:hypothetical protein
MSPSDAEQQTCGGKNSIIGAEHGGSQPSLASGFMAFTAVRMHHQQVYQYIRKTGSRRRSRLPPRPAHADLGRHRSNLAGIQILVA